MTRLLAIPLILALSPALSQEACRATDGDTIRCGDQPIRIIGVDTPEIFTPEQCSTSQRTKEVLNLGYAAKGRLDRLLTSRQVRIEREGFDKYGRIIGHVFAGPDNVATILIREGYGRPYTCTTRGCPRRQPWC